MKRQSVEEIHHKFFGYHENNFPDAYVIAARSDTPRTSRYLAFVSPGVGSVEAFLYTKNSPPHLTIDEIHVQPRARNQDFGTALLAWALKDANELGAETADLCVTNHFVVGAVQRLLVSGKIREVAYIKSESDGTDIFQLPLNEVFTSLDRISAEEAISHMTGGQDFEPAVSVAINI